MNRLMKQIAIAAMTCSVASLAFAKYMPRPAMDKVIFNVSASRWITTSTANVVVSISATLDKQGLADTRAKMMANLDKIADADWHITMFNRTQDASGLERLNVQAVARVAERHLSNLRENAKQVSKPGAKYSIANIQFTPSAAEVAKAKEAVRGQIYQQLQSELQQLNKAFPSQHYSVYRVNFAGRMRQMRKRGAARDMVMFAGAAPEVVVSNKVTLNARAVLAANRHTKADHN